MTILPSRVALMRLLPPQSEGVEVGVFQGDFAAEILSTPVRKLWLVDCWKHLGKKQYVVHDPDDGGHETNYRKVKLRFDREIAKEQVSIIRGMSHLVAGRFVTHPAMDFVYLDADHGYEAVMADLTHWSLALKPDGWLMGHDYTENESAVKMGFGVKRAVDEFCRTHGWQMIHLTDEEWPSYALVKI